MLLPHIKLFFKIKRGLELVFLPHFLYNFLRKLFLLWYFISWPSFFAWLSLLHEILGNVYCNCLLTRLWRREFWNQPYLSNQAIFSTWPKQEKNLNILRMKRAFNMKQRAFFIIFKGLSLKHGANNTVFFVRWEPNFNKYAHTPFWFSEYTKQI